MKKNIFYFIQKNKLNQKFIIILNSKIKQKKEKNSKKKKKKKQNK